MFVCFFQMEPDLDFDIDLSFLDSELGIDKLSTFHAIFLSNSDVDMRVLELKDGTDIMNVVASEFSKPNNITQVILPNGNLDEQCPYFRIIMQDYNISSVVNYKLETFMRAAGILGIHARCTIALVVGLASNGMTSPMIDIPSSYRLCHIEPLNIMAPIDMTCMSTEVSRVQGSTKLMDIPGMRLPYYIPQDLHWHIFKYLRHPCAVIIQSEFDFWTRFMAYWDMRFQQLFGQL